MAEQESEQARRDADLEAAVLDTLTDSVLTGAAHTLLLPSASLRLLS